MGDWAIRVRDLRKEYRGRGGPVHAVNGVDLEIRQGECFGLLGPNGAGKSTLINILAGLTRKSEGKVVIWGRDIDERPRDARAALGVVPARLGVQFIPRHGRQQPAQLRGGLQLVLARGGTDEEAAHHRLADVGPVEPAVQPGIAQPQPHLAPDHRLIALDQLARCPIVAGANPTDELRERVVLGHARLPSGPGEILAGRSVSSRAGRRPADPAAVRLG